LGILLKRIGPALAIVAAVLAPPASLAQTATQWLGTWTEGPTQYNYPSGTTTIPATTFSNIVHTSIGGSAARIQLTNEMGINPLQVGQVTMALADDDGNSIPGTMSAVTFGGRAAITIPPGAAAISDKINMTVPALTDLVVNIYVPQQAGSSLTYHRLATQNNYQAAGNQVTAGVLQSSTVVTSWFLLKAVDVQVATPKAIVAYGDSLTDGKGSTTDANTRWPDDLAANLAAVGSQLAVLNQGMGGDCLLNDTGGTLNSLERLNRDVLSQSGAKYVIVFLGTNDISQATSSPPENVVTASDLIWGLSELSLRIHERGLKAYVATITPAAPYPAAGQAMITAVNQWILSQHTYDAVFDFNAAVRDPNNTNALLPVYDSGDGVHLTDAGYAAIANSINLSVFQ
jgi:lysophospholipase L1-like esterase